MEDAIDRSALVTLSESVGEDFVGELIDTFEEEAPELFAAMRRAQTAGDADGFRRAAHSFKSNANTFGATRLAEGARELEAMARANDLEVGSRIEDLEAEYKKAVVELKSLNTSRQE